MPDDPSAALEEIKGLITRRDQLLARIDNSPYDAGLREAEERFNAAQDKLAARTPLLVAALEAVLKLADTWDAQANQASDRSDAANEAGETGTFYLAAGKALTLDECTDALREAISRVLADTGQQREESGDGG